MGTISGIGWSFRGWKHLGDGTSIATRWFTLVYFPILPLRRYRVRLFTDFENERVAGANELAGTAAGVMSWSEPTEILEHLPFSFAEALGTYLRCYVLIPLLCLWPFVIFALAMYVWGSITGERPVKPPEMVVKVFIAITSANVFTVLLVAVRRMRGHPGRKALKALKARATRDAA